MPWTRSVGVAVLSVLLVMAAGTARHARDAFGPADRPRVQAAPARSPGQPAGRQAGRARIAAARARLATAPAARRVRLGVPLDINAEPADALVALPRIGPVLAARIVAERERAGPFRSVDGLAGVPGIGPATLERLRPFVVAGEGRPGPGGRPEAPRPAVP